MPLVPSAFASVLLTYTDETDPGFVGFPETPNEVATAWMESLNALFVAPMTSPLGAGGSSAARDAGIAAMEPLITPPVFPIPPVPIALAALQAGFLAYGAAFAAENPVSVPPPAPFTPPPFAPTTDPVAPANAIAAAAAAWAATGTWTPGPPPVPVVWS